MLTRVLREALRAEEARVDTTTTARADRAAPSGRPAPEWVRRRSAGTLPAKDLTFGF